MVPFSRTAELNWCGPIVVGFCSVSNDRNRTVSDVYLSSGGIFASLSVPWSAAPFQLTDRTFETPSPRHALLYQSENLASVLPRSILVSAKPSRNQSR